MIQLTPVKAEIYDEIIVLGNERLSVETIMFSGLPKRRSNSDNKYLIKKFI